MVSTVFTPTPTLSFLLLTGEKLSLSLVSGWPGLSAIHRLRPSYLASMASWFTDSQKIQRTTAASSRGLHSEETGERGPEMTVFGFWSNSAEMSWRPPRRLDVLRELSQWAR